MNVEIKAVHFDLEDEYHDLIGKKLQKIEFAQDMIVGLACTVTKEKNYAFEADIHFRWGPIHHFKANDFDLRGGIDKLFDKIGAKVTKEKGKIKEHTK
jgi:putative sigma-54 modulation protein